MQFLAEHSGVDVVFSRYIQETREDGKVHQAVGLMPEPRDDSWSLLVRWDLPQTGALLWRKSSILRSGGWKECQPCCQEHELYLRMLKAGTRFQYSDAVGAVYRQWNGGSVCTRNPQEVHRRRLEIVADAEKHLRETQQLTEERLWAINQARLEVARLVWLYDPAKAVEIDASIHRSQPEFEPGGLGGRISYRVGYRMGYLVFGFCMAERVASLFRRTKVLAHSLCKL